MTIDSIIKEYRDSHPGQGELDIGIVGHVRPDGDCVGTTCGLYYYLKANYPEFDTKLFLEPFKDQFSSIIDICKKDSGVILDHYSGERFDILFSLDASEIGRIGVISEPEKCCELLVCVDHHISNPGFAKINVIDAEASSASQVLFELLDPEKITVETADCLMTGIVHDTGVFRHQNTKPRTMEVASTLLGYGAKLSRIVNETYFQKSFAQLKISALAFSKAYLEADGRIMCCVLTKEDMNSVGADVTDLDGIVDNLRGVDGVECAVFMYQSSDSDYKVSLRSNLCVNVSEIAGMFGGGGHVRASGYTYTGNSEDGMKEILAILKEKMAE